MFKKIIVFLFCICVNGSSYAIIKPRNMALDHRLKILDYHPQEVFEFTGVFYYLSLIEFEPGESINKIIIGKPKKWQVSVDAHRLFIKPIGLDSEDHETNMLIVSNKRRYFFELYADNAENVRDPKIPFLVSFNYPEQSSAGAVVTNNSTQADKSVDISGFNKDYSVSGSTLIEPIKMYDDNEFTYIQFKEHSPMPAIMEVTNEGYEGLVNYKKENGMIVVEGVFSQLTLRYGTEIACVFNNERPLFLINQKK